MDAPPGFKLPTRCVLSRPRQGTIRIACHSPVDWSKALGWTVRLSVYGRTDVEGKLDRVVGEELLILAPSGEEAVICTTDIADLEFVGTP